MTKLKIALILLSCVLRVLTENRSTEAQERIDNYLKPPPDKTVPQTHLPHAHPAPTEEPSFMSKVASWIFPFGGGTSEKPLDAASSETQQRYASQYLPLSQNGHSSQNGYYNQPCNPCNREPWIPVAATHGQDTVIGFVQQPHIQNHGYQQQPSGLQNFQPPPLVSQHRFPESQQYGVPVQHSLPQQYGAPQQQYGIPRDHYGVPTNVKPIFDRPPENFRTPVQHFLPPPLPKYPVGIFKNNGLPSQKVNPLKQGFPPSKHNVLKSGPSKLRLNSPPQHGPPIPLNFGKPQLDKYKFSNSPSVAKPNDFKLPLVNSGNNYVTTYSNQGVLLQPPPYDYLISPYLNYDTSFKNGISNSQQLPSIPNYNPVPFPISSGNVDQNLLSSSRYNYPGQSNSGLNNPPAFPGLNLQQNKPLQNQQSFQSGFSSGGFDNLQQHESKVKIQTNSGQSVDSVQVIPSIRVADYLASIEHPINVIQSPLVEVIASENVENKEPVDNYDTNKVQLNENPIVVETHDEDAHAAATAQNLSYYNPALNEKRNNNVATSLNFNNQNLGNTGSLNNLDSNKGSSSFDTSGVSDEQLRTILQSQNPYEELSGLNVNFTQHLIENHLPQGFGPTQIQNNTNIYKGNENQFLFTQPPMDYSNWTPTFGTLSTSMVPPPLGQPVWNTELVNKQVTSTTKKPKQVQIIIPYISNNRSPDLYKKDNENIRGSKEHQIGAATSSPSLPVYTQPPSLEESVWSHYIQNYNQEEQIKEAVPIEKSKSIANIKDILLKDGQLNKNFNKLPFDIIRLQKNIDDWTEQEFSNGLPNTQKASTSAMLVPSKKIPSEYFTTQPYDNTFNEVTTIKGIEDIILYDHEPASSQTKISKVESNKDIDTNFIFTATTPFSILTTVDPLTSPTILTSKRIPLISSTTTTPSIATTEGVTAKDPSSFNDTLHNIVSILEETVPLTTPKPMWDNLPVSISPLTKEKVYVVTPQPWKVTPKEINEKLLSVTEANEVSSPKFAVVIQPEGNKHVKELRKGGPQIVYSEWPHLINNLQTTTTTEKPKPTSHPLFGLMDLSSYTPPPNSTVETYGGHSRVITVVTPTSVTKKATDFNERRATTKTVSIVSANKTS